jgi:hypothetical protein
VCLCVQSIPVFFAVVFICLFVPQHISVGPPASALSQPPGSTQHRAHITQHTRNNRCISFFVLSKHVLCFSSVCLRCLSKDCARCVISKTNRLNEEEDDHVTAESSYLKMKSRCAMMAAELEKACLRLQLTEQIKNDGDAHLEQALKALQDKHRIKEELASELELVRCCEEHDCRKYKIEK